MSLYSSCMLIVEVLMVQVRSFVNEWNDLPFNLKSTRTQAMFPLSCAAMQFIQKCHAQFPTATHIVLAQ